MTGFGCIEVGARSSDRPRVLSFGVLRLNPHEALPLRLKELSDNLREIIEKLNPDYIVVERIFLGKNADSAFKLGHARGVVFAEAARHQSAQICEYSTREVKKGVGGSGAADKTQVQKRVEHLLGLKTPVGSLDASDALALALYQSQKLVQDRLLRRLSEHSKMGRTLL
jgi:crossover junction endodeoxyribonuclease RuvC